MTQTPPILWSFRRCPYAMRARLAVQSAGLTVEIREILLRDKPQAFLETSPSATVPALRLTDRVIDESLDIMVWALEQRDSDRLLNMSDEGWDLIETNDGPFKRALDHTKYASRYPEQDPSVARETAAGYLKALNARLGGAPWLFGPNPTLADIALLPFVRQFAHIDLTWFSTQDWPDLQDWLNRFLESPAFESIMQKYKPWEDGADPVWFGHAPDKKALSLAQN